jgi:hypothetical protein
MTQPVVFKMADVMEQITEFKHAPADISVHEYYLAVCTIYLTQVLVEQGIYFEDDYYFDGSFIDDTGVRWLKYQFRKPETAMMVKLRGIGE